MIDPITPPPELVDQWFDDAVRFNSTPKYYIARQAALWGADMELEACRDWLRTAIDGDDGITADFMYEARRPKPPSLKEQALSVLDDCADGLDGAHENVLRRALEQLDD